MMYQMVCLDLDGTLLNRSRAVSMENRKALIDCLDRGIYIYLVTGRPPCLDVYKRQVLSGRNHFIPCSTAYLSHFSASGSGNPAF